MKKFYDSLLTVNSALIKTDLTPQEFKDQIKNKFGLKKRSLKDIFSFGGELKYSGEITDNTFKITQGNSDNPGFFFFSRVIGNFYEDKTGTKIEIKIQYSDLIYYGLIPSLIVWIVAAYMTTWTTLIGELIFIGFIGFYGRQKIKKDYNQFRSDLSLYTNTEPIVKIKK